MSRKAVRTDCEDPEERQRHLRADDGGLCAIDVPSHSRRTSVGSHSIRCGRQLVLTGHRGARRSLMKRLDPPVCSGRQFVRILLNVLRSCGLDFLRLMCPCASLRLRRRRDDQLDRP